MCFHDGSPKSIGMFSCLFFNRICDRLYVQFPVFVQSHRVALYSMPHVCWSVVCTESTSAMEFSPDRRLWHYKVGRHRSHRTSHWSFCGGWMWKVRSNSSSTSSRSNGEGVKRGCGLKRNDWRGLEMKDGGKGGWIKSFFPGKSLLSWSHYPTVFIVSLIN